MHSPCQTLVDSLILPKAGVANQFTVPQTYQPMSQPALLSKMMEKHPFKFPPLLSWGHWLYEQVSHIVMGVDVSCTPLIMRTYLVHEIVQDYLCLLQCWLWSRCVGQNRLVITVDERWSFNQDAQYHQLVGESANVPHHLLHYHKLSVKRCCLNPSLLLPKPMDGGAVQEDEIAHAWATRYHISSKVIGSAYNPPQLWHVSRKLLI